MSAREGVAGLRVFISYPRGGATQSVAMDAQTHLRSQGAIVFRDETDVPAGDPNVIRRIEDELTAAHVLAFFAGADTPDSIWQQREFTLAELQDIPVVVVQTSTTRLPFYIIERQPVRASGDGDAWLPRLAQALAQAPAQSRRGDPTGASTTAEARSAQRRAELAYLAHLLAVELWDRPARYTALAAQEKASASPLRSRRDVPFDVDLMLSLFDDEQGQARPTPDSGDDGTLHRDVLTAYRELLARRGPGATRLVVLGDPGAGKSFSLERLFCTLAEEARADPAAPLPLLLVLGDWTRAGQGFERLLEAKLRPHGLDAHWPSLREQRRAFLLLDGLNEIPVAQRQTKVAEVFQLAQDQRWAGVVLSCRERDFEDQALRLPFDQLKLQPLAPPQVLDFLHRWALLDRNDPAARQYAEARFWQLAAGSGPTADAAGVWQSWQAQGASFEQFWQAEDVPHESPDVFSKTTGDQDALWRDMRHNPRSLLRLAASPYWLTLLAMLPDVLASKPVLVEGFLRVAHANGVQRCRQRAAVHEVPPFDAWRAALVELALALQGSAALPQDVPGAMPEAAAGADSGAQTRLARNQCPAALTGTCLEFAIGVEVLRERDGQVSFGHQLMQEALAAVGLVDAARGGSQRPASALWPRDQWWRRNGWEVVADLAAEAQAGRPAHALQLVAWLAEAQPEVALTAWRAAGAPPLPDDLRQRIACVWAERWTDPALWPRPEARAAIGRALGGFDLDQRHGVGLRADGAPDIDWVPFHDGQPFQYQGKRHKGLPPFALARYPITHRQFQAFIDDGGYAEDLWWQGMARRFDAPAAAWWAEPNVPRERVSWFEAVAFCRWLTQRLGCPVRLPTEQEWERAAAGRKGWAYPTSPKDYLTGHANLDEQRAEGIDPAEAAYLSRTSAVGIYPQGASADGGVLDLAGNVWEWCLNAFENPQNVSDSGDVPRVLRGGSWFGVPSDARASNRFVNVAGFRNDDVGFRVCRASPIQKLPTGASDH